jgi:hypothetical protein
VGRGTENQNICDKNDFCSILVTYSNSRHSRSDRLTDRGAVCQTVGTGVAGKSSDPGLIGLELFGGFQIYYVY